MTSYIHIIANISSEPRLWHFKSEYDARIAQVCIKSVIARSLRSGKLDGEMRRKLENYFLLRQGPNMVLWTGLGSAVEWPLQPKLVGKIHTSGGKAK